MNERGFIVPVIMGIIVVAIVGVGAAMYLSRQNEDVSQEEAAEIETAGDTNAIQGEESELTDETETGSSLTGTVSDLLKTGQNMTCAFSHTDTATSTSGTVYVAGQGQRMRGDFVVKQADDTTMNAHVIRDGGLGYFWSDELAQGTKIALSGDAVTSEQESAQQDVLDESIKYDCRPWTVDSAVFNVPANKEFIDFSQQLQPGTNAAQQVPQAQCSTCEQLQEPAKSQCLKALGC